MSELLLGKTALYKTNYDKSLLFPIERASLRQALNIGETLPFNGYDLWNCYEVSWLNAKGKPTVRILHFVIPATSEFLVESKSIKLYLNSLNNTKFASETEVLALIKADLSEAVKAEIEIEINKLDPYHNQTIGLIEGISLDDLDVEMSDYEINAALLKTASNELVEENLYSNLFKSNCLVTGQPDWASIAISYSGAKIDRRSLLKYLVSYRNHNGFHEDCVEHIFVDIMNVCRPKTLSILAKYTRRGGVDINPFRTTLDLKTTKIDKIRDVRQ